MSIKTFVMIPRRADISAEEFHDHWRYPHATWGSRMTTIQGYVQSHHFVCEALGPDQATYEGVAEAWFSDMAASAAFRDEPVLTKYLKPDEPEFIDVPRLSFVVTEEEVIDEPLGDRGDPDQVATIWSPWRAPTSVKLLQFVAADGNRGWADGGDDRELGKAIGALRHVRCRAPEAVYGSAPPWLGVRELQWPTLWEFRKGIGAAPDALSKLLGRAGSGIAVAVQAELFLDPTRSRRRN